MNKLNFLKKSLIASAAMMAMPISTAFALGSNDSQGTTLVSYEVVADGVSTTSEWEWSIPSAIVLASDRLQITGVVSIGPKENDNRSLVFEDGTYIKISASSSNFELDSAFGTFYLKHGENSKIAYHIDMTDSLGSVYNRFDNEDVVLHFTAGTSDNGGINAYMRFMTTEQDIKKATLLGVHDDTLTFRVETNYTPPVRTP